MCQRKCRHSQVLAPLSTRKEVLVNWHRIEIYTVLKGMDMERTPSCGRTEGGSTKDLEKDTRHDLTSRTDPAPERTENSR